MNPFRSEKIVPSTPANLPIAPQKSPRTQRFYGFIMLRGSALIIKTPPKLADADVMRTELAGGASRCWLQTWPKLCIHRLCSCEDESTTSKGAAAALAAGAWCSSIKNRTNTWKGPCSNRMLPCKVPFCSSGANLRIFSEGGPSVRCTSLTRPKGTKMPRCPTRSSSLSQASVGFLKFKTSKIKSGWILKTCLFK